MINTRNDHHAYNLIKAIIQNATAAEAASALFLMSVFDVGHRDRQKNERYDASSLSVSSLLGFSMHDSRIQELLNEHGIEHAYGTYQIQTRSEHLGRYHAVNKLTDFIDALWSEKSKMAA